jgi:hypothetical protein
MFKELRLLRTLKKLEGPFVLLPDGLYTMKNQYVRDSLLLKNKLPFLTGDLLKLVPKPRLNGWNRNFQAVDLYHNISFESVNVRELDLDLVLTEIKALLFSREKDPYENFLEVVLIKALMESLNDSKSLLGGIWAMGGLMSSVARRGKSSFAYFAQNIEEKNRIIIALKEKLNDYPDRFVKMLSDHGLTAFSKSRSPAATFLEYRVLQVRYKIVLQEICLHSSYLTGEEKKKYDDRLTRIKALLLTYPARPA